MEYKKRVLEQKSLAQVLALSHINFVAMIQFHGCFLSLVFSSINQG